MTYIIAVAGMGTRLHPYTLDCPKALYRLDEETTLLGRLVADIQRYDPEAEIVVCTGFAAEKLENSLTGVTFVYNPFYAVTNSLSTLWFARDYLNRSQVTIIDGDIIAEHRLVKEVYCAPVDRPTSLIDTSKAASGDYCAICNPDGTVVSMSKNLKAPTGEYCNVTKLDRATALLLKEKVEAMIRQGRINEWMETAVNQLVFADGLKLYTKDIAGYRWAEIDDVTELAAAKRIHLEDK